MIHRFILSIFALGLAIIPSYASSDSGYLILDNRKSFEKQVVYSNTSYVIRDEYRLNKHFRFPSNCTLIFQGGMLTGVGILEGDNTSIEAPAVRVFGDNITIGGTWTIEKAYCEWFGGRISSDNNAIPIQKCIDSFNMLSLNVGLYRIKSTLNVVRDGCLISGVSRSKSGILKSSSSKEDINAVFNISNTKSQNIQHITVKDLRLSSIGYNVDYGIYTDGINSSEFRNLTIFQCKNGFYCNNETHGAIWNLVFDNIECNSNTLRKYEGKSHYGYKEGESCGVTCVTNGGASVQFNKCWVRDCAIGFYLKGLGYSQLNMCAADNIHGAAYIIEYCRLAMNECGMESVITTTAVHLYQSQVTLTGFNDYNMIAYAPNETYRIKVDGGTATFTNCYFSEWVAQSSKAITYGITADYGASIVMNNTFQPRKVIRKCEAINGASIKYIK